MSGPGKDTAALVCGRGLQGKTVHGGGDGKKLPATREAEEGGSRGEIEESGVQSPALGSGAHPFVAQPLAQTVGELRENAILLPGTPITCGGSDLLEANNYYLRISSK